MELFQRQVGEGNIDVYNFFFIDIYQSTFKVPNLCKFIMKTFFKEQLNCESLLKLEN